MKLTIYKKGTIKLSDKTIRIDSTDMSEYTAFKFFEDDVGFIYATELTTIDIGDIKIENIEEKYYGTFTEITDILKQLKDKIDVVKIYEIISEYNILLKID